MNNEKGSVLGWIAFATSFTIQLVAAVWIIANMNAMINEQTRNINNLTTNVTTIAGETQQNTMDIKLIQQQLQKR